VGSLSFLANAGIILDQATSASFQITYSSLLSNPPSRHGYNVSDKSFWRKFMERRVLRQLLRQPCVACKLHALIQASLEEERNGASGGFDGGYLIPSLRFGQAASTLVSSICGL
jgi:hypothetical protein